METFLLDPDFIKLVRKQIYDNNLKNSYDEICGNLYMKDKNIRENIRCIGLKHNSSNMGGTEDNRHFCEPEKKIDHIVFHTHPIDPIPSGEDIIIVALNDCVAESTQAHVELLFTPYGYWVFHRTVKKNGKMILPYVRSVTSDEDFLMSKIAEFQKISYRCCQYIYDEFRAGIPIRPEDCKTDRVKQFLENIPRFKNEILHASRGRVMSHFYKYSEDDNNKITIPKSLLREHVQQYCLVKKKWNRNRKNKNKWRV